MADFDPVKHPRNTRGEFSSVLDKMEHGVSLPGNISVDRGPRGTRDKGFRVVAEGRVTHHPDAKSAADHALTVSARSTHPDSLGGARSHKDLPSALKANRARARRGAGKPRDVPNPTRLPSSSKDLSNLSNAELTRQMVAPKSARRDAAEAEMRRRERLPAEQHFQEKADRLRSRKSGADRDTKAYLEREAQIAERTAAQHARRRTDKRGDGEPTSRVPLRDKVAAAKANRTPVGSKSRSTVPDARVSRRTRPRYSSANEGSNPVVPEADRARASTTKDLGNAEHIFAGMPGEKGAWARGEHMEHALERHHGDLSPSQLRSMAREHMKRSGRLRKQQDAAGKPFSNTYEAQAQDRALHHGELASAMLRQAARRTSVQEAKQAADEARAAHDANIHAGHPRRGRSEAINTGVNHDLALEGRLNGRSMAQAADERRALYDPLGNRVQAEPVKINTPADQAAALRNRVEREKIHLTDHEHRALAHMQEKNKSKVTLMSMRGDKEHTLEGLTQKVDKESANPSANTLKLREALSKPREGGGRTIRGHGTEGTRLNHLGELQKGDSIPFGTSSKGVASGRRATVVSNEGGKIKLTNPSGGVVRGNRNVSPGTQTFKHDSGRLSALTGIPPAPKVTPSDRRNDPAVREGLATQSSPRETRIKADTVKLPAGMKVTNPGKDDSTVTVDGKGYKLTQIRRGKQGEHYQWQTADGEPLARNHSDALWALTNVGHSNVMLSQHPDQAAAELRGPSKGPRAPRFDAKTGRNLDKTQPADAAKSTATPSSRGEVAKLKRAAPTGNKTSLFEGTAPDGKKIQVYQYKNQERRANGTVGTVKWWGASHGAGWSVTKHSNKDSAVRALQEHLRGQSARG